MYIVQKQDLNPDGGANYLMEASKTYGRKYRLGKVAKQRAATFANKSTAQRWAKKIEGKVSAV